MTHDGDERFAPFSKGLVAHFGGEGCGRAHPGSRGRLQSQWREHFKHSRQVTRWQLQFSGSTFQRLQQKHSMMALLAISSARTAESRKVG
ncbi:hypothetical protein [Frigoriglobus tundricola]|uniref:hypothetical protein n=1 Tax=Frigoriglobus tundricola TaxID=2774151 RepID=UPI00148EE60D|nr:hypothetical protein [Frigoriglobus tundricola]